MVISLHPINDNRINKHLKCLIDAGYEVIYVNASDSDLADFELHQMVNLVHIPIPYIKKSSFKIAILYMRMKKEISKNRCDVLHIHDPQLLCLSSYARRYMKTIVYDRHELYDTIPVLTAKLGTLFEKKYQKYIDGLVYVVSSQEKYNKQIFPETESVMIPNYQCSDTYDNAKRRKKGDEIRIIYIGVLSEEHRQIILMLRIIQQVLRSHTNCRAIIGGECADIKILAMLNELSNEFPNFTYKGSMKYSEVVYETVNADIGLAFYKDTPNSIGASSNKIYEYLMAGLTVVAMGEFVGADEIENEGAGIIFEYQASMDYMVNEINRLIDDHKRLCDFMEKSYKLGRKYTWENVEQRYIQLYQTICRR